MQRPEHAEYACVAAYQVFVAVGLPPALAVADYDWSRDSPSKSRRTLAIWAFVIELRVRLSLVDQKWAYPGGFNAQKCVICCYIFLSDFSCSDMYPQPELPVTC